MSHKFLSLKITLTAAFLMMAGVSRAGMISFDEITPSSDLIPATFRGHVFSIDQIADGITSDVFPYNGFASDSNSGIITLDFDQPYTLTAFEIWNDVNVNREGIKDFRLEFFDQNLDLVGLTEILTAPVGQFDSEVFEFDAVSAVSRVNLNVLSSNDVGSINRIEIREVSFHTLDVTAVPEPSSLCLILAGVGLLALMWRCGGRLLSDLAPNLSISPCRTSASQVDVQQYRLESAAG